MLTLIVILCYMAYPNSLPWYTWVALLLWFAGCDCAAYFGVKKYRGSR